MEDLTTDEQCDKCKEPFKILIKDFEQAMKDGDSILCPDCETKALDEQIEAERPPKRCFEYRIEQLNKLPFLDILNEAGSDGWELVSVDNRDAYFKREFYEDA